MSWSRGYRGTGRGRGLWNAWRRAGGLCQRRAAPRRAHGALELAGYVVDGGAALRGGRRGARPTRAAAPPLSAEARARDPTPRRLRARTDAAQAARRRVEFAGPSVQRRAKISGSGFT
eukprot:7519859-Pyramimonas_sp.AAC.1